MPGIEISLEIRAGEIGRQFLSSMRRAQARCEPHGMTAPRHRSVLQTEDVAIIKS
jgi:hypothetical protein